MLLSTAAELGPAASGEVTVVVGAVSPDSRCHECVVCCINSGTYLTVVYRAGSDVLLLIAKCLDPYVRAVPVMRGVAGFEYTVRYRSKVARWWAVSAGRRIFGQGVDLAPRRSTICLVMCPSRDCLSCRTLRYTVHDPKLRAL